MLRLAITSARGRLGTFTGALVALFTASVLAMAWGMQLEAILRTQPPVERYAGTAAVVTGQQTVGADHDVGLSERARVSSARVARLAAVPGVRAAIGDVSVPAALGNRNAVAHGWSSATLSRTCSPRAVRPHEPTRWSLDTRPGWARGCRWHRPRPRALSPWSASLARATRSRSSARSS